MRISTWRFHAEKVVRVLDLIHEELDAPLELADLARHVHTTPFHFHRMFRQIVGETVQAYIRRRRLYRAANQLMETSWSILDIAIGAGYQSNEAFTRAFKRRFGLSPSCFRKQECAGMAAGLLVALEVGLLGGRLRLGTSYCDETHVVYVALEGPHDEIDRAWLTLYDAARRAAVEASETGQGLAMHPHRQGARYGACIELDDEQARAAGLPSQVLPRRTCVVGQFTGPLVFVPYVFEEVLQVAHLVGGQVGTPPSLGRVHRQLSSAHRMNVEAAVYAPVSEQAIFDSPQIMASA